MRYTRFLPGFALGPIYSAVAVHLFSSDWRVTLAVLIIVTLGNLAAFELLTGDNRRC
jgi:hypothetical protein